MQAVVLLSPKSSLVSILMGHDGSVTTIRGTHTPPPAVPSTQHPAREAFSYLEPVCCSMSSSNCCFLTCIQISQEAGQVVWYFHLFQNFPQFIVIHTVKGFGIVNKAEIDVFLELSCFSMIQQMLAI